MSELLPITEAEAAVGLRRREITGPGVSWNGVETVTVLERWDLRAPNCPMYCFDLTTMQRNPDAISVDRFVVMPKASLPS